MIGQSNGVLFVRHNVSVHNLGVMGCSTDEVARVLSEVPSSFAKVGLAVHGLDMSGGEMKALGVELESRLLRTSVTRERYWRLHGAPSYLSSRGKANREMLELLVRHCMYAAPVRRPMLSVFHCENPVHSGRAWETGGALAIGSRGLASFPRLDAIPLERLVAALESARQCQQCLNYWVWDVDIDADAGGGSPSWTDA